MTTYSTTLDLNGNPSVVRVDDDGSVSSVAADDPAYLATLPAAPVKDTPSNG